MVHVASQFIDKPSKSHLEAVNKIFRYVKSMPGQRLFFLAESTTKIMATHVVIRRAVKTLEDLSQVFVFL